MRVSLQAFSAVVLFLFVACSSSAQPMRQQSATDVVATVGPTKITLGEADELAMAQHAGNFGDLTLAQALYEARRAALDAIVGNHLLDAEAKASGTDRGAVIEREITGKVTAPSDADIAAWYAAYPDRVGGATIDQVSAPIRSLLIQERTAATRTEYLDRLKAKTPVVITLEPPRLAVSAAGRPSVGPATAPVQIIEFSDFQCPFCFRANPTVKQVLSTYGDRVSLVYRHYPLPNHPNARPAAEAAACANEQGRFWDYHDRLFANQNRLGSADLKQHAAELGLDAKRFNDCFDSRKYESEVDADIDAGEAAGVSGTPAFFVNGRSINGAQPFENFKRIIDDELSRQKR
jgi:protein-disulfide isomerase